MEFVVMKILRQLGLPYKKLGFIYICDSIILLQENFPWYLSVTKTLYVDVAIKRNTEPKRVERCIRHCIEQIWSNIDDHEDLIVDIFGKQYPEQRPSNKNFLCALYYYINENYAK